MNVTLPNELEKTNNHELISEMFKSKTANKMKISNSSESSMNFLKLETYDLIQKVNTQEQRRKDNNFLKEKKSVVFKEPFEDVDIIESFKKYNVQMTYDQYLDETEVFDTEKSCCQSLKKCSVF